MKAIIGVALLAVCAFGQTFENIPVKTQIMRNPLLTETGMNWKLNGEWNNVLTLQELIQHPLFQVYYNIPLFKAHFTHPLFQHYLTTTQFQTYWTHPLFPTFFQNQVLFYKYIYPQVFNTNVQTPMVTPLTWFNKMYPTQVLPTNNYDELVRKVLGGDFVQKEMNVQGLYWDKVMKNTFMNVNKPEEVTEVKTEVKIPVPTQTIVNPIDKILKEKIMIEESPVEMMKDTIVKDDLLKKIYLEKMMNKMNINKMTMTPEEFALLQTKMEELIPSRIRRNANYVQIPTTFNYNTNKNVKALPFFYNVPTTQGIYYTQPQTTFTNTVGTPYTYTNTVGTPFTYTNTFGTPYTYTNTVGTQFLNTPVVYPTQTVV